MDHLDRASEMSTETVRLMSWLYCQFGFYIKAAHHEFGLGSPEMIRIKEVFGQGNQGTPWWNTRGVENRRRHLRALPHRIRRNPCEKNREKNDWRFRLR